MDLHIDWISFHWLRNILAGPWIDDMDNTNSIWIYMDILQELCKQSNCIISITSVVEDILITCNHNHYSKPDIVCVWRRAVVPVLSHFKAQLQPLMQRQRTEETWSSNVLSLTVDCTGWAMELCFASVAPARDVCFVQSEEADAPPPTGLQELMGSGIVGYLHQFPLGGDEGEGRRGGQVCFHCELSIGWQALWH